MRKAKTKTLGQIQHAIQRAGTRYGLQLSEGNVRQIAEIVRSQDRTRCEFVHTISTRLSVWKVLYAGRWLIVAYDKGRHNVATLLPPNWTKERAS